MHAPALRPDDAPHAPARLPLSTRLPRSAPLSSTPSSTLSSTRGGACALPCGTSTARLYGITVHHTHTYGSTHTEQGEAGAFP
eukprot:5772197-Prymnesium_polylepis.1